MKKLFQHADELFKEMNNIFDKCFECFDNKSTEMEQHQIIEKDGIKIETILRGKKVTLKINDKQVYSEKIKK